jgi:hypothetical protein
MANYYTEWAETIDNLTDAELAWAEKYLVCYQSLSASERDGMRESCPEYVYAVENEELFTASIFERQLFMYSENGGVEEFIEIMSQFIKKFRPEEHAYISWAEYCDKPRSGSFGGGACIIYKDHFNYIHTSDLKPEA